MVDCKLRKNFKKSKCKIDRNKKYKEILKKAKESGKVIMDDSTNRFVISNLEANIPEKEILRRLGI